MPPIDGVGFSQTQTISTQCEVFEKVDCTALHVVEEWMYAGRAGEREEITEGPEKAPHRVGWPQACSDSGIGVRAGTLSLGGREKCGLPVKATPMVHGQFHRVYFAPHFLTLLKVGGFYNVLVLFVHLSDWRAR